MIRTVAIKEIRETIISTRFAVSFALCAFLILLAFYSGGTHYKIGRAQYEAARAENLRQLEGLTDWLSLRQHRIFLPPQPLASLVGGVSNDIGRTTEVYGRGELDATGSKYSEDPLFAVFRYLDLEFIFSVVLSLLAILAGYDAICGEKERGTLKLALANPVPRRNYIIGKIIGLAAGLFAPLLITLALGALLLPLMGIPFAPADWLRLILIIIAGLLYVGAFLSLAVLVSSLTDRSSHAFLLLLVIWIGAALIIPRAAVLLAARSVPVPMTAEISAQKAHLNQQLWREDRQKMATHKFDQSGGPDKMMESFHNYMDSLADARESRIKELTQRLVEERTNGQKLQENLALSLARLSPAASFTMAASALAGTSLALKNNYAREAAAYQTRFAEFFKDKTGVKLGRGMIMMKIGGDSGEQPQKIDPNELPPFEYKVTPLGNSLFQALPDMGILIIFNLVFLGGAVIAFLRYDAR